MSNWARIFCWYETTGGVAPLHWGLGQLCDTIKISWCNVDKHSQLLFKCCGSQLDATGCLHGNFCNSQTNVNNETPLSYVLTLASLSKRAKRSLRILTSSSGSHVVDNAKIEQTFCDFLWWKWTASYVTCKPFDVSKQNGNLFVAMNINLVKLAGLKFTQCSFFFKGNVTDHLLGNKGRQYRQQ